MADLLVVLWFVFSGFRGVIIGKRPVSVSHSINIAYNQKTRYATFKITTPLKSTEIWWLKFRALFSRITLRKHFEIKLKKKNRNVTKLQGKWIWKNGKGCWFSLVCLLQFLPWKEYKKGTSSKLESWCSPFQRGWDGYLQIWAEIHLVYKSMDTFLSCSFSSRDPKDF